MAPAFPDSFTTHTNITPEQFLEKMEAAPAVFILAGAGMSAEFGIPVYWTGDDARYGGDLTEFGLTPLQHATAEFWDSHADQQAAYHAQLATMLRTTLESADPATNHYVALRRFLERRNIEYFVTTTNIDSAFQKFGYDMQRIHEVHGAVRNSQCLVGERHHGIFPASPHCPQCGAPTRPNCLFFDDWQFVDNLEAAQFDRYADFLEEWEGVPGVLALELGVGTSVPRLRDLGTRLCIKNKFEYLHVNTNFQPGGSNFEQIARLTGLDITREELWLLESCGDALKLLNTDTGV